jgi:hypothetical protein
MSGNNFRSGAQAGGEASMFAWQILRLHLGRLAAIGFLPKADNRVAGRFGNTPTVL